VRLLDVVAIDVSYGPVTALRDVSLHIDAGEMVALLGANGAGKTTTLRAISGRLHPTRGSITFDGEDITAIDPHRAVTRGIAHLPEGRELFPTMTVDENLRAGAWSCRRDSVAVAAGRDRAYASFPILAQRSRQAAGTLSGGEQQMLAVARALMSEPRLLIVDELSLGLAPMIVEQLFSILRDVNAAGTAILIVEQFVSMALSNTDRAYVLSNGRVALNGRSTDLLGNSRLVTTYLGDESNGSHTGRDSTVAMGSRAQQRRSR